MVTSYHRFLSETRGHCSTRARGVWFRLDPTTLPRITTNPSIHENFTPPPPKNTHYTVFPITRSVRYSVIFHSCYVMLYYVCAVPMEYRINLLLSQPNKNIKFFMGFRFMKSLIQTPVDSTIIALIQLLLPTCTAVIPNANSS